MFFYYLCAQIGRGLTVVKRFDR